MVKKSDAVRCVMLPNQKRQIVSAIGEAGLSPGDFEWNDCTSEFRGENETALIIKHRHKDYYFTVDRAHNDSWWIEFCPAGETEWTKKANSYWTGTLDAAKKWAKRVAIELEDEDYVELAIASPQLLSLPLSESDQHVLTNVERNLLTQRLDEIEQYVLDLRHGSEEFERQVRSSLQFLKEHAKKSDRRSLYALVFSTLLSIGLTFLSPAETRQVIQHATTALNVEMKSSVEAISLLK